MIRTDKLNSNLKEKWKFKKNQINRRNSQTNK